jgi:hypothetical protein
MFSFHATDKDRIVSFGTSDSQMFDQDEKLITKAPYLRLFAWAGSSLPRRHRQPVISSSSGTLPLWPGRGTSC